MKLYVTAGSGNSYKVRILLGLLKLPCETVVLSDETRDYKQPWFQKLNPRGEVPVLDDDGTVIWDSAACLVYLARKYGGETWLPADAAGLATVMQWLALAASEIQFGLQYARRGVRQGRWTAGDLATSHTTARVALAALQDRLASHPWLAFDRPTIADIACFAYVENAGEGKFDISPYPDVIRWIARCKALAGWPSR